MSIITTGGFYVLNEEYGRWSEVYEDKAIDSREAFESLYELIGMILSDYSNVLEEQWCDELSGDEVCDEIRGELARLSHSVIE